MKNAEKLKARQLASKPNSIRVKTCTYARASGNGCSGRRCAAASVSGSASQSHTHSATDAASMKPNTLRQPNQVSR